MRGVPTKNGHTELKPGKVPRRLVADEFRRGIMRSPFATITFKSSLSKVWYLYAHPETTSWRPAGASPSHW